MTTESTPRGHNVTPYLSIKKAAKAIEFYKHAFGAVELYRLEKPNGEIGHAEIKIGDSTVMLADPCESGAFKSPQSLGGSSIGLYVYVEDVDERVARAVEAGAKIIEPVKDQFYGDRSGSLEDPFGHIWFFATHKEDLSPEEISRRAENFFQQQSER